VYVGVPSSGGHALRASSSSKNMATSADRRKERRNAKSKCGG